MTTTTTEITSRIQYNRANRDYDCFVTIDGAEEYIGSARNYSEGETKCNAYAYDHYSDTHTPEVAVAIALGDVVVVDETEACIECDGEGRIPSHDCCGDQAGGWAETCDFCNGTGKAVVDCLEAGVLCPGYVESAQITCEAPGCIQAATHTITTFEPAVHSCCFHYSEEFTGVLCDCRDDDYGDALAESAQGTYNGKTPAAPIPADALLAEVDALLSDGPRCPGTGLADCGASLPAGALFCTACTQTHQRIRWAALYPETQERWVAAGREWEQRSARIRANVMARIAPTCRNCGAGHTIQNCPEIRALLFAPVVEHVIERAA